MVKITSFILIATAAAASLNNNTVAIPVAPVNETAPVELIDDDNVKDPMVTINSNDPFSAFITHRGKATWFTDSYGACHEKWNGYNEPIVALNAHQMGSASWGNPICNRRVRIVNKNHPSRTVTARIVDKCPGDQCAWGSLDLSPYAFKKLGLFDTGIFDITWNYV
ncbi:hypothetical protein BGX23_003724 [Mortierella sp. AD031]|nr:hypothetical protein BGX23_003724 [Mortierella sp. AD031]KAG0217827.1 hypothetical protein BGX33_009399 [Mortierella sp. NVP41]